MGRVRFIRQIRNTNLFTIYNMLRVNQEKIACKFYHQIDFNGFRF